MRVLDAMRRVPRHAFVPADLEDQAYEDRPLPIGYGQTISQPYIVALMTDLLRLPPGGRALEIGTGSGYQAAVLAALGHGVHTIEIVPALAEQAAARLSEAGFGAVEVRQGDGYFGWPDKAPFDGIVVTAAAPQIPPPLLEQLKPGGRMVIPVGAAFLVQQLILVEKLADGTIRTEACCRSPSCHSPAKSSDAVARGNCAPVRCRDRLRASAHAARSPSRSGIISPTWSSAWHCSAMARAAPCLCSPGACF